MMTWKLSALALCAVAMPPALSADASARLVCAGPALDEVDDALEEITDEYMAAFTEFRKAYSAAKTDEERGRLREEGMPDPEPYAARVLALVQEHPGTDAAWQGLNWVIGRARGTEAAKEALLVITREYVEDERLGDICLRASRSPVSDELVSSLERVVKESPHREVRGKAAFSLGMQYKQLASAEPEVVSRGLKPVRKPSADEWMQRFKRQMQLVIEEYGDVPYFRGDLEAKATGELFQFDRLQIGMIAPDIEGEDLDGVGFSLSDYRGKVVVLDFWGNW
jgi:hypothetical protein